MKKVAILQSNYIPWKGYFDLINKVDEFIFYDEMQYTNRDWRNRNKIKTNNGLLWLSVPVLQNDRSQKINETYVIDDKWKKKHFETIRQFYSKAKAYKEQIAFVEDLYLSCNFSALSDINRHFITRIAGFLGIKTKFSLCEDYGIIDGKTERLLDLVLKAGGTEYISGPAAKDYIVPEVFSNANVTLTWMDYGNYPEYEQPFPPFEHGVSILDLILSEGDRAKEFMNSF